MTKIQHTLMLALVSASLLLAACESPLALKEYLVQSVAEYEAMNEDPTLIIPTVSSASTETDSNTPTWTWERVSGAAGYRYQLDSEAGTWTEVSATTFSFTPATALSAGTHTLNIQARNAAGLWTSTGQFVVTITSSEVPVAPVAVTGIALNKSSTAVLQEGGQERLFAYIVPLNATNLGFTWSTTDATVATVDTDGLVTAKAAGTATILVSSSDGGFTAMCKVTVSATAVPVEGITLNKNATSILVGGTEQLYATITPSGATNQNLNWNSSDETIATVSAGGLVTAKAPGSAVINAITVDAGKPSSCTVTVTSAPATPVAVAGISISSSTLTLPAGGATGTLTATLSPTDATNQNVSWVSSAPSIALVGLYSGVVSPIAAGSATITATTQDSGKTATCAVTVTAAGTEVAVTGITLTPTTTTIYVGATQQLSATVAPENASNKNVTWSSDHPEYATVSSSGLVSGVAAGSTTITATTEDGGKTASCTVTVSNVAVTGVTLNKSSTSILAGSTEQLTATIAPANATNKTVTWSSNNTNVATVSATGLVNAVLAGSATITVTTADGGKTATCTVTVTAVNVAVTGVTLNKSTSSIEAGSTEQLTATIAPANATNKTVAWSSNNTNVATVGAAGLVNAVLLGSATITATTVDGSFSYNCVITVTDTTHPTVSAHTPGTVASITTVDVVITFSEAMNTASATSAFLLKDSGSTAVPGTFSWSAGNTVMTFNPTNDLTGCQTYTYSLATTATDVAGNVLSAGIGNTSFTVTGLFSETPVALSTNSADSRDVLWDSVASRYVAIYTDMYQLQLASFTGIGNIPMASTVELNTTSHAQDAIVMRTGSSYSVVWYYEYGATSKLYFNKVDATTITTGASVELRTPAANIYVTGISATWNSTNSEIGIVWCEGGAGDINTVYFMRVNANGTIIEGPVSLTDGTKKRHSTNIFWTSAGNYTVAYIEPNASSVNIAYARTIDASAANSVLSSAPKQLTTNTQNILWTMRATWTGSELGLLWLDQLATSKLYFNRFDKDGNLVSGMPSSGYDILASYTDASHEYIAHYTTTYDNIDFSNNGSSIYGLAWSQRTGSTVYPECIGPNEVQFCTIENIMGTWKAPSVPVIISQDNAPWYLRPFIDWDGSKWIATWQDATVADMDVYFRY